MKINRALGLGLVILIFKLLTNMWTPFEDTVLTALDVSQTALGAAEKGFEQGFEYGFTPYIPTFE